MASTYSTNLAIELIGTGDQAGSWGNTTNTNLGTLIEQAISGYVTQAVSTGTDTTITIPNGATGVARNMYIELTGTGGASTNLIVPANKKLYFIFNNSTGAVTVKVSGQTGVSVPQGKKVVLTSNGTDVVNGLNYIADFGSNSATITQLTATSATITNLTLTSLVISNLSIASANITTLTSASATITNLLGTTLTISGNSFLATSSGNVGVGTTSPASKLTVSGDVHILSTNYLNFTNTAQQTYLRAPASNTIAFGTSSTEQMRLDSSGNLGIGTASPAQKLHVASAGNNYIVSSNTAGSTSALLLGSESGQNTIYSWTTVAGSTGRPLAFYTGASEVMRLDTSGNLGLGVTPVASFAGYRTFQIASQGVVSSDTASNGELEINNNAYRAPSTANLTYINSFAATKYAQYRGEHRWFNAPSGTAGNAISFTQAMTLNAANNLIIGKTTDNDYRIQAYGTTQTQSGLQLTYGGVAAATFTVTSGGALAFGLDGSAGATERARITSTGLGISEGNNPTQALSLYRAGSTNAIMSAGNSNTGLDGTWFGVDTAGNGIVNVRGAFPLIFSTSALERARITAAGDLALGATATSGNSERLYVAGTANLVARFKGTSGGLASMDLVNDANKSIGLVVYASTYSGGSSFNVGANGAILGSTTAAPLCVGTYDAQPLLLGTNSTERGRFTAGGSFLVGTTTASDRVFYAKGGTSNATFATFENTVASGPVGIQIQYSAAAPNNTGNAFLNCLDNAATRAVIRSNGGLANFQANNVDLSDARTKNSIAPAASMWDKVAALEIVAYKYNDQTHDDVNLGVIAQQVETVEPVWVDADGFGETLEGEEPLKTVYTKDITFAAIKALQEAMARIESLEAKVSALEAK